MKVRLRFDIAIFGSHGARPSRAAAALAALVPCCTRDVIDADLNVERTGAKCLHGAGGQARLGRTGAAKAGSRRQDRQPDAIGQDQCAAVGVPEPPLGVDEQTDRTSVHGFAAGREPLKRQRRRGAARIDSHRSGLRCHRIDNASRPAIEGVRQAIARLGGTRVSLPLQAAGEAQEDDRSDAHRGQ